MSTDDKPAWPALLPCPWCGARPDIQECESPDGNGNRTYHVACMNPDCIGIVCTAWLPEWQARKVWNRRATTTGAVEFPQSAAEAVAAEVDALGDALDSCGHKTARNRAINLASRLRKATSAGGADGEAVRVEKGPLHWIIIRGPDVTIVRHAVESGGDAALTQNELVTGWLCEALAATAPKRVEVTEAMVDAFCHAANCATLATPAGRVHPSRLDISCGIAAALAARADGWRT